jgi:hypothetical protein
VLELFQILEDKSQERTKLEQTEDLLILQRCSLGTEIQLEIRGIHPLAVIQQAAEILDRSILEFHSLAA